MTDLFIKRPVATTLLMAALIFFGVVSYFSLPISEMPSIDFPTIQVSASLPGADPQTMLIGIVKKNSIMVIDFAIEAEREGKTSFDAVFEGCVVRFRPIMMTTVAAIAGIFPIALGYGAGGDARQPLGLVVAGGLVISQMVTLYLTPVFYTYMDEIQNWLTGHKEKKAIES